MKLKRPTRTKEFTVISPLTNLSELTVSNAKLAK